MGQYLATHRLQHGELTTLARYLGESTRTLRTWKARAGESRPPGHPAHSAAARARALAECERVWGELPRGHDGWRSVSAVLEREGVQVAVRLVQASMRELKRCARERERERIEERRVHVEVLARDALWTLDQTHVLRDADGELKALAVRESMVPRTLGLSIGPPACGRDVVRLLKRTAEERGGWPFVIQVDNGRENKNAEVEECLREVRVIALWNEPHTPQHNPRGERGFCDLKMASDLDVPLLAAITRKDACARLLHAWARLDRDTPRYALHGLTPVELDRIAPRAEDLANRDRFYAEVCLELERIALEPNSARARCKLAREAIWRALERHSLVNRTRGGCPIPTVKAVVIS